MPDPKASADEAILQALLASSDRTGDAMLRLAATQTACLVISDAAGSLRRMSMVFEAAATAALVRSLEPGGGSVGSGALDQAERTMRAALDSFIATTDAALRVARVQASTAP